jgi:hypothetical protein
MGRNHAYPVLHGFQRKSTFVGGVVQSGQRMEKEWMVSQKHVVPAADGKV